MKAATLPTHKALRTALVAAQATDNGGIGNHMWAVVVNRLGLVTAVAFSGKTALDQWTGSRPVAAAKALTANGLSLTTSAMSTANAYSGAQPGGFMYGIAEAFPGNPAVLYGGNPAAYGTSKDPFVGKATGGAITFAGGLGLYNAAGMFLGALGLSGDTSCADHNIAWKVRHALELDYVPNGVCPSTVPGAPNNDNIIYDIDETTGKSASGWGHPACGGNEKAIGEGLPMTHPIRTVSAKK
jgi:uncharacterized protein GlcG (DUF336 family)